MKQVFSKIYRTHLNGSTHSTLRKSSEMLYKRTEAAFMATHEAIQPSVPERIHECVESIVMYTCTCRICTDNSYIVIIHSRYNCPVLKDTCILCIHQCIAVTRSQTAKFGFECIDTAYCGQTKEQAFALMEQPRQGTTQQSEFLTLAEEAQCCVLYNSHIGCSLTLLMFGI